jgi:hypothetical protein
MNGIKIGLSKNILAVSVGVAVSMFGTTANADPFINGSVSFSQTPGSTFTLTGGSSNFETATGFDFGGQTNNLLVVSTTLSGLTTTFPTMSLGTLSSFTFGPAPGVAVNPLWKITSAGSPYSFAATSFVIDKQTANAITLHGYGKLSLTGYADTDARWDFSANNTGSQSFSMSTGTVPVPGTLAILGLGLAGMSLTRRKKA